MKYNPNIHNRQSIRLKEYDYSQSGLYFVTICLQNRECLFGEIINDEMQLSAVGVIADVLWYEIKNHVPNLELHEFIVMPNHIHGIIEITSNTTNNDIDNDDNNVGARHALPSDNNNDTRARHALPLPSQPQQSRFQNQGKNTLSSIVGSYKSAVTKHAHRLGFAEFAWLRNYYEMIIRNKQSYQYIANYIINNPQKWNNDKYYEQHI